MSQYPSAPAPTEPRPAPIGDGRFLPQVEVDYPERQRRLTVAFRLLLLIPHMFVLYGLGIAAEVLAVIGWFAALFTGRLPDWVADFQCCYVAWAARVQASELLLVDEYPPFEWRPVRPATRVELRPGLLNRWSVFFRFLLCIPAVIVSTLAVLGWGLASFVIWLVVLIMGRNPRPLFDATAAVLRFQVRTQAYFLLLTSAYPRGILGDKGVGTGMAPEAPEAPQDVEPSALAEQPGPAPDREGRPAYDAPAFGPPAGPPAQPPGYGQYGQPGYQSTYPPPETVPATATRTRPLLLSGRSKALVWLFVVLGVLYYVGVIVAVVVVAQSQADYHQAARETQQAYQTYSDGVQQAGTRLRSCNEQSCVHRVFQGIADDARTLTGRLDRIDYPSAVQDEVGDLEGDLRQVASAADRLKAVSSPQELGQLLQTTGFNQLLQSGARDVDQLVRDLRSGG